MSDVMDLWASRAKKVDPATYVGQQNRLWYNPVTNSIFVSDGVTPGGAPVDLATGANIVANIITVNSVTSTSGNVGITGNLVITGNISPATETKIGGVKAGPGANISNDGTLTIDTAGLPLSFGDFTANLNVLTLVNEDQDMILATQGNAEIQLVGNIGFYKSNGLPPDPNNLFFFAQDDGQITILVPDTDPVLSAVQIIGSAAGDSVSPAVAGVMLHITGQPGTFASQYIDGINNFPNYIGRRYNGTVSVPTQVMTGNTIVRFSGQGYSTGGFSGGADGSISLDALEDFTESNQGAIWRFLVNPVGGNIRQQVANIAVATGVSATQFNTSGNVTAGNVLSTETITSNSKTAGIGYRAGAGDVVTQLTSKSTPVTLNAVTGEITTSNSTLNGDASVTFVLTNSAIANTDVMIINHVSGGTIGKYTFNAACNNGNASITIHNVTSGGGSAEGAALVLRYVVIRGAVN